MPKKMLRLERSPVDTVTHKKTISPVLMILLVAHFYCTAKIDQAADLLKKKDKRRKRKRKKERRHDEEEE